MSTSLFHLYEDPENATARASHKSHKTVKSSLGARQASGTPRKALVDINHDPASIHRRQTGDFKKPAIPPVSQSVANKGVRIGESIKGQKVQAKSTPQESTGPPWHNDDIEMMLPRDDAADDYEDLLPKAERLTTYLSQLIRWRPTCLINQTPSDSDGDSDDACDYIDLDYSSDCIGSFLGDSFDVSIVPEPECDEIPLPALDDLCLAPFATSNDDDSALLLMRDATPSPATSHSHT